MSIHPYPARRPGLIRTLVTRIANRVLTDRAKRSIFISSIVGMAYPLKEPDSLTIEKLNKMFSLVNDPHALELPIYVKTAIWKDCDLRVLAGNGQAICPASLIYGTVSKEDADKLVTHVVDQTPRWLRYQSLQGMHEDMSDLIKFIQHYDHEPAMC